MKEIWKYAVPAILGMVIGALIYHVFQPDPPTIKPPENVRIIRGPAVPDTVYVQSIIRDTVTVLVEPQIETQTDVPDRTTAVDVDEEIAPVGTAGQAKHYVSEKQFEFGPFVGSHIWAWSRSPVDSFKNEVDVKWNYYYQERILPRWEYKLKAESNRSLFKGIIAGAVVMGGLASEKWYVALPAIAVGTGVVLYF